MHRPVLKVRWAGPFVLALLLASAVASSASAASRPAAPAPAAVTVAASGDCFKYAVAYVFAVDEFAAALSEWYFAISDPNYIGDRALVAAERLDRASEAVAETGILLTLCLLLL